MRELFFLRLVIFTSDNGSISTLRFHVFRRTELVILVGSVYSAGYNMFHVTQAEIYTCSRLLYHSHRVIFHASHPKENNTRDVRKTRHRAARLYTEEENAYPQCFLWRYLARRNSLMRV